MALLASCLGHRGKTSGVENGLHGTANFSISQPIAIPSQRCWTENAARISSIWTPYHSPYSSETVWEGDSMAMGSSQLSSAAQNYSQLLSQHEFYDHTAHARCQGGDRQISQHWPQNEIGSSLSGSEDSYFNQFPNATTTCGSSDDDDWESISQIIQDLPLLQQQELPEQGLPEQGLQTTAPDDVETILGGPDIDTIINTVSTSYVEGLICLFAHDQSAWNDVSYGSSCWPNTHSCSPRLPVNEPTISIITQAPKFHRARYEREAESGAKGLLKTESKKPMAIQMENVTKGTGDIILTIIAVTTKGAKHPYVYTSCLGRGMPASWKQDAKKRTVTIVLREKEGYRKCLSFLAIKRNRMENIDLTSHKKDELCYFQIKFEAAVPSAFGDIIPITAISQSVRILCPSTATRRRRESEEGRSR